MTAILSSIRTLTEDWRRPKFRPQCTHITMLRVYGPDLICDHCRRPGQFGWIYRCSQDREDVIDYAVAQGYPSTFDTLGDHFVPHLGVRKRSRAARESSLSFFDEITSQQMTTYRPDQVATILKQRENVHEVIAAEKAHKNLIAAGRGIGSAKHYSSHDGGKEDWMDGLDPECQYQICSECRPGASDRAFQSLNAIANGEILPCTATGYGFHILGGRPIADARVVKNIGQHERAAIFYQHDTHCNLHTTHPGSLENLYDRAVSIRCSDTWEEVKEEEDPTVALLPPPLDGPSTRLKHSPRYENLSVFSEHPKVPSEIDGANPWTPPPSPRLVRVGHSLDIEEEQSHTPIQPTHNDASMRKRMLQNSDRIYALLEGRQVLMPVSLDAPRDMAVSGENVERPV